MAKHTTPPALLGPADMRVIDHVFAMGSGYVLDFSDRRFDEFVAHEIGIDATAARYATNGGSKAKRLRTILHSLSAGQQAKLLRAFWEYREGPAQLGRFETLDDKWRAAFEAIVRRLEDRVAAADEAHTSSAWTGRRTIREQVLIIRGFAPVAMREIDELATLVENKRFNDPDTADAIDHLRQLHGQLGELLEAVDRGNLTREAVERIEEGRRHLVHLSKEGAKLAVVAPAMTFGIMHLLSWISGVPVDSTMVSAVFGSIVGADALRSIGKKSSLAAS